MQTVPETPRAPERHAESVSGIHFVRERVPFPKYTFFVFLCVMKPLRAPKRTVPGTPRAPERHAECASGIHFVHERVPFQKNTPIIKAKTPKIQHSLLQKKRNTAALT